MIVNALELSNATEDTVIQYELCYFGLPIKKGQISGPYAWQPILLPRLANTIRYKPENIPAYVSLTVGNSLRPLAKPLENRHVVKRGVGFRNYAVVYPAVEGEWTETELEKI